MRCRASRPARGDLDDHDACVGLVGDAVGEAELLEPAHLTSGRRRIHAGRPGQLAQGRGPVLVDAPQQRVGGPGEIDPGRRGQGRMPVAVGPQAVELLERTLGAGDVVHRWTLPVLV